MGLAKNYREITILVGLKFDSNPIKKYLIKFKTPWRTSFIAQLEQSETKDAQLSPTSLKVIYIFFYCIFFNATVEIALKSPLTLMHLLGVY